MEEYRFTHIYDSGGERSLSFLIGDDGDDDGAYQLRGILRHLCGFLKYDFHSLANLTAVDASDIILADTDPCDPFNPYEDDIDREIRLCNPPEHKRGER